jgi:hypothetical protein
LSLQKRFDPAAEEGVVVNQQDAQGSLQCVHRKAVEIVEETG